MLTTFYPPWGFGGDAVYVRRLARALARHGHDVTVVHSREAYAAMGGNGEAASSEDMGVRLVPIDAGWGRLSPLVTHVTGRPLLARNKLRDALDDGFDVLHYHNPSLLGGPEVMSMGRGVRVYTLHEQWLVCPTHVLLKYQREVCVERNCLRCQLSYGKPPQLWRPTGLLDRSVAALDALIAPSRTSAALHRRFADKVRIEHIPHFVEEIESAPSDPDGTATPNPYFLCVGRLEPIKGIARAIAAFGRGRTEELLVVGTGSLEASLRRRAASLPHVRFLGARGPTELAALYRGARAVIVPSVGHESFGLVAVEAFAHGTPAIVPNFGALAELVEDSGGGIVYSDDAGLDRALARLAADDALRATLGRRGREAVMERWTVDRHLDRYLALIGDLARSRGDGSLAELADISRRHVSTT